MLSVCELLGCVLPARSCLEARPDIPHAAIGAHDAGHVAEALQHWRVVLAARLATDAVLMPRHAFELTATRMVEFGDFIPVRGHMGLIAARTSPRGHSSP